MLYDVSALFIEPTFVMDLTTLTAVPMLDVDGRNWPIFKMRFKIYLASIGLGGHFDAANYPAGNYEDIEPMPEKIAHGPVDALAKRMDAWRDGEAKWKESVKAWKREDAMAMLTLGRVLPDSIFLEILEFKTFRERWEAVEQRLGRGVLFQKLNIELKDRLDRMYCRQGSNVLAHLQEMEFIYHQLAARNAKISDGDYVDAIIRSIPHSYSSHLASLQMIFSQFELPITPAAIKDIIRREHETRQTAAARNRNEVALHADTGNGQSGRGRRGPRGGRGRDRRGEERDQSNFVCFNCGGKGHKAAACPSPKMARGGWREDN